MAELDEKLNALLSDPNSMAQIMQMAQQLSATMGGGSASPSPPTAAAPPAAPTTQTAPQAPAPSLPGGIDPQVVARFLPLLQEYSRSSSQTMQLLYALRPFLKESKQDKVERAARLARLIHLGKKFLMDWGGRPCITATSAATAAPTPASARRTRRCRRRSRSVHLSRRSIRLLPRLPGRRKHRPCKRLRLMSRPAVLRRLRRSGGCSTACWRSCTFRILMRETSSC